MVTKLYIGTEKLDLFADENISLNSSIADVSDITKNTTEFTKGFTVPASDINNEIFKHYYEANIDGGFDARIKIDGKIELDGIPFKTGKFRLNGVKLKNGLPDSYNINFWGNLVNIKDALTNNELKDLDLSAYDHDYDSANVETGLTTSLFSGDLVYVPLVKKQYYYNSDVSDNTQTDTLSNIAYGGGGDTGIVWNNLKPSIKLIKIIEAIETDYSLSFSRDFFGRSEFDNLFLWMNSDAKEEIGGDTQLADWDTGVSTYMNLTTNIGVYPARAFGDISTWFFKIQITPSTGYETVPFTVRTYIDGAVSNEVEFASGGGGSLVEYESFHKETNNVDFEAYFEIKTSQEFKYTLSLRQVQKLTFETVNVVTFASENTIDSTFVSSLNAPKIKLIDFMKGLFNMFKLVVIPLDDGTIYVNTLKDYYAEGSLINITKYVDTLNYSVDRGDILNEILFQFEEPETILNKQFDNNTGIPYGNEETFLYDENNVLLDGDSLDFTLPFEQVVYERLVDLVDNTNTFMQYGAIIDEKLAPVNPKSHIFYNINQGLDGKRVGFIDDVGAKSDLGGFMNLPSHTNTFDNFDFSVLFGEEYSTWNGQVTSKNLYSNYHQDYILSIFNIKRRNFNFKAKNFPYRLLTELSLNDVVQIKSDYYRIDSYDLNLLTNDIEFKLINSFDNTIVGFYPDRTGITVDFAAQSESIFVVNLGNFTDAKVDTGDGIGWVTVTSSGGNIFFTFTENSTENSNASDRSMIVSITNDLTLQTFDVILTQTQISYDPSFRFYDNRNSQYLTLI